MPIEEVSNDWWWMRVRFDGVRNYYDYVLLPIYNWVICPIWVRIAGFFGESADTVKVQA